MPDLPAPAPPTPGIPRYFGRAWEVLRADLVGWLVFYGVFVALSLVTCGFFGLMMPTAMRETRDAVEAGRGPALGRLFDTSHLGNDLLNSLLFMSAMTVGGALGGVGSVVAALLLQMLMPLAAEDRYAPVDNAKLSVKHVLAHTVDHVVFYAIAGTLGLVSVGLCLVPLVLVAPLVAVAHWLWYRDSRDQIDTLAEQAGIRPVAALPD